MNHRVKCTLVDPVIRKLSKHRRKMLSKADADGNMRRIEALFDDHFCDDPVQKAVLDGSTDRIASIEILSLIISLIPSLSPSLHLHLSLSPSLLFHRLSQKVRRFSSGCTLTKPLSPSLMGRLKPPSRTRWCPVVSSRLSRLIGRNPKLAWTY